MASTEFVLMLFASTVVSTLAMIMIVRSWWRNRLLPTLLYSIAIACFTGMMVDLLLDFTYEPFTRWALEFDSHRIWVSNLLLSFFIVGGFLFWYFAIMYSQYETPPRRALFITFIAGGALIGEIESMDWSTLIPLLIEAIAFGVLIYEIVRYALRVTRHADMGDQKFQIRVYFIGFLVWISAGPLGVILANIPGSPDILGEIWPIPYGIGMLLIAISVAKNPKLLYISEAKPLDFLVLNKDGNLLLAHRFSDYDKAIDQELMGSAMSGILSLMKEMLASAKDLHGIDHGDVKILVETGNLSTVLLIVNRETASFRQGLRNALLELEANYRQELKADAALLQPFEPFRQRIKEIFQ
ncbi:MAG: membrane protein of unknown function [Candidatus Thorarchaeota archaeon]|nr:MAG: membrane protein of unknown function [Candidatus Thorarchaeota archaeon]